MKWIGQHIWDYISRFRNDVYLEDISTGTIASGGNLGLDANNKIVKADTEAGELAFNGSTANGVLTYGGAAQIDVESTLTYNSGILTNIGTLTLLQLDGVTNADVLNITNLDADQKVIDIIASNTTADIIDINSSTLTTGAIINCDITQTGVNTALLDYNILNTDTSTSLSYFEIVDFNKTGVTGDGEVFAFKGIHIDYDDSATNHANSSVTAVGIDVDLTNSSDQGTVAQTGIDIYLAGADAANSNGLIIRTPDNAADIKVKSQDDANDLFTLDTKDDGETTLTTIENGGGSTAHFNVVADGDIVLDSASGIIKTGSTTFVNNSGVVQVATQGTIDHDSLANFVAAEHYRWDTDISATATIHTENITDLHGAGVDGAAGSVLTDAGNGKITDNADFTWDGSDLTVESATSTKPEFYLKNTNSDNNGSFLKFVKDKGAAGAAGDYTGSIEFWGDNSAQEQTKFAEIYNRVGYHTDTDEAGDLYIKVAASDGSTSNMRTGLTIGGHGTSDYVDVHIGYGTASTVTLAGGLSVGGSTAAMTNAGELSVAAQPNITTMTGFLGGTANALITDDGDGTVTSESNLTWDGEDLELTSSVNGKPRIQLTATNDGNKPATIEFIKDRNLGNGVVDDFVGRIDFKAPSSSDANLDYISSILVQQTGVIAGSEAGMVAHQVISDGATTNWLVATGSGASTKVDVSIGNDTDSTTTIAGEMIITGDQVTIGGSSSQASSIYFSEDTDNGTNKTALNGAAAMTSNRTITLPDASGTVVVDTLFPHIMNCGFNATSTSKLYLPFSAGFYETSSPNSYTEYHTFVLPYNGYVDHIILRSEYAPGNTTVGVHTTDTNTEWPSTTADYTTTVNMAADDTPYKFSFGSGSTFTAGQTLVISADVLSSTVLGDCVATMVIKFDLTNGL